MGNPATLQPNVFSKDNQPAKRGRKKGVPNRATIFNRLLKLKAGDVLPDVSETEREMTLLEAAALGQVLSARKGNTNAWKEIQDTLHGKMADKTEVSGPNGGPLEIESVIRPKLNDSDSSS